MATIYKQLVSKKIDEKMKIKLNNTKLVQVDFFLRLWGHVPMKNDIKIRKQFLVLCSIKSILLNCLEQVRAFCMCFELHCMHMSHCPLNLTFRFISQRKCKFLSYSDASRCT